MPLEKFPVIVYINQETKANINYWNKYFYKPEHHKIKENRCQKHQEQISIFHPFLEHVIKNKPIKHHYWSIHKHARIKFPYHERSINYLYYVVVEKS